MSYTIFRKITVVLTILIFSISCERFDNECDMCSYVDFYYYKNEPKQIGELSDEYLLLGYDSAFRDTEIKGLVESYSYLDKKHNLITHQIRRSKYKYTIVKLRRSSSCSRIKCIQDELMENSNVGYVNYTSIVENCVDMLGWKTDSSCVLSYGDIFYVKVKDTTNLDVFYNTVNETGTEIISQYKYRKAWFTLSADKESSGNALQMANYFFETGLFSATEPGFAQFEVE